MSILQLRFNKGTVPSGWVAADKGNVAPPWWDANTTTTGSKVNNKANWYSDGNATTFSDVFVNHRLSDFRAMFQFGQDKAAYASAKFFSWRYEIKNEKVAKNGTVDADVTVHIDNIYSRQARPSGAGLPITNSLTVGGTTVASFTGHSIDRYDRTPNPNSITKHVTIPGQQAASGIAVVFHQHYSDGSHPDLNLTLGIELYNPSPTSYSPMVIKTNGKWGLLNDRTQYLFVAVKKGGKFVNNSKESLATQDQPGYGHCRYKGAGGWRQMPLPTGGSN